jgi:DNA-directed RNA polymerase specialized sigma24 family protein
MDLACAPPASPFLDRLANVDDDDRLHGLVTRTVAGDPAAWQALWVAIEPRLLRIVGHPAFLGRIGQREDDRRNIVLEVIARLEADGFRRLAGFLEAHAQRPGMRFTTWLRVLAKRVGIDYLRAHAEYADGRHRGERGAWVEVGTLPSASRLPGGRPPVTDRGTAQELLRYAADAVPDLQRRALELWVQTESYDEIARRLELADAREAERTVRAAIERLRRRFREDQP